MKRKNLVLTLTLLVFTFISCSEDEHQNLTNNNLLSSDHLVSIHHSIRQSFSDYHPKLEAFNKTTRSQNQSYTGPDEQGAEGTHMLSFQDRFTDNAFETNYNYALSNGIENLFVQYGLDPEIVTIVDWAMENINDENLYANLQTTFSITNEQDAYLIFYYIELYEAFDMDPALSGCARAVIGTILTTAVFAGVTFFTGGFGGAAAAGFLISKGWSIYNVVEACSEQATVKLEYFVPEFEAVSIDINDPFNLNTNTFIP